MVAVVGPAIALALCLARAPADNARSTLSGPELTYLSPDGRVKIHYTLSGIDALPDTIDADPANGVPDTVDYAAEGAGRMMAAFVDQDGWPAPPSDEGRGGDDRLDIYLKDIPANGFAFAESFAGGVGGYVEVAPHRKVEFSKEVFESIVGHEVHHILEFTAGRGVGASWILEASATWAQYLVFAGDDMARLAQGFLWFWRLKNMARPLDDSGEGDLFEYAGMVWLRFLVDRGGGDRKLGLDLWRAMGATHDWVSGHDAFVRDHLPGLASLDDAAAEFAVWNALACSDDDGHHYRALPGTCAVTGRVNAVDAALPGTTMSVPVGMRGSAYAAVKPDCASGDLHLSVEPSARMRISVISVVPGSEGAVQTKDATPAQPATFDVAAWNQRSRVVVAGTSTTSMSTFKVTTSVSGSYAAPATFPPPSALSVTPAAPLALAGGERADLAAAATYGTCADGRDVTAEVTWRSSDEKVATVARGSVAAVGPGTAQIFALAGSVMSSAVEVTVTAAPDGGCGVAPARPPVLTIAFLALFVMLCRVITSRPD